MEVEQAAEEVDREQQVLLPVGVVAGGSLSPRGEWRAPSDGNAEAWLAELRRNVPEA